MKIKITDIESTSSEVANAAYYQEIILKISKTAEKKKESVTEDVFETPWLRRLLELKDIEELDRDIIVEMIDQITVYENRKLKISYNFGNELEHLFSSVYCEDLEKKAI